MKTIHNYRDKEFVRILDNTYSSTDATKAMIGDVYEVHTKYYHDDTLTVYNKDKSNYWYFNKSDTQICYPDFVIDGHVLGNGDVIENKYGGLLTVYDTSWDYNEITICVYHNDNENSTWHYTIEELKTSTLHSTIYPRKEEVTELTLEDIAKKFNVDVKSLKIKK